MFRRVRKFFGRLATELLCFGNDFSAIAIYTLYVG